MSVIGPRPGLWNQDILTAERDKRKIWLLSCDERGRLYQLVRFHKRDLPPGWLYDNRTPGNDRRIWPE